MCKKGLINIDNEFGPKVVDSARCEVYTMGIDNKADLRRWILYITRTVWIFTVVSPWFTGDVRVNIPGKFSVYNALAAIGTCALMGVPFEYIKKGLEKVTVPGRAEVLDIKKDYTVMIDYAHSPDSLKIF